MKKNFFFKSVFYLFLIFIIFAVYLFIYLFPTLKTINNFRVGTKDYRLRLNDIKKADSSFKYSDNREKKFISSVDREFEHFIRFIDNSGSIADYLNGVGQKLVKIAENSGLKDVCVKIVKIRNRGSGESSVFETTAGFVRPVSSGHFKISLRTTVKNFIKFLEKLRFENKLFLIEVVKGKSVAGITRFTVDFDILYRTEKSGIRGKKETNFIDLNSPLLSERVYASGIVRIDK